MLILQAALRNTDARYYDAAEVMGASSLRQFFDITLPNCKFGLLSAAFVVFVITLSLIHISPRLPPLLPLVHAWLVHLVVAEALR